MLVRVWLNSLRHSSQPLIIDVYTILAPYVVVSFLILSITNPFIDLSQPMITQVSGVLDEGSKAVINNDDQYQVRDLDKFQPHSIPNHHLHSRYLMTPMHLIPPTVFYPR